MKSKVLTDVHRGFEALLHQHSRKLKSKIQAIRENIEMGLYFWDKEEQNESSKSQQMKLADPEIEQIQSEIKRLQPIFTDYKEVKKALTFNSNTIMRLVVNAVNIAKPKIEPNYIIHEDHMA